jgi:hypothetical protein
MNEPITIVVEHDGITVKAVETRGRVQYTNWHLCAYNQEGVYLGGRDYVAPVFWSNPAVQDPEATKRHILKILYRALRIRDYPIFHGNWADIMDAASWEVQMAKERGRKPIFYSIDEPVAKIFGRPLRDRNHPGPYGQGFNRLQLAIILREMDLAYEIWDYGNE